MCMDPFSIDNISIFVFSRTTYVNRVKANNFEIFKISAGKKAGKGHTDRLIIIIDMESQVKLG